MFKQVATILNRLVAYLFTAPSLQTEIKHSSTVSNLPVKSGQPCKDAQIPVAQKPKRKPSTAKADTTAASRKQTPNPVLAVLGQGGLQRQILASQPVSQSPKRKRSVAPSTKAVQSPKRTQKLAPPMNGKDGLLLEIPASKTRQVAKAAPTKKQKAAASTTPVKKRTKKQTPAQTHTARQSKARGS